MTGDMYETYREILRSELIPAQGCTEPIAIAYAAAKARQVLGRYNWQEMVQARRVVEIGIVRIAARNANRDDKIAIRSCIEAKKSKGSTSFASVAQQIADIEANTK